jgi:hypothetical protein
VPLSRSPSVEGAVPRLFCIAAQVERHALARPFLQRVWRDPGMRKANWSGDQTSSNKALVRFPPYPRTPDSREPGPKLAIKSALNREHRPNSYISVKPVTHLAASSRVCWGMPRDASAPLGGSARYANRQDKCWRFPADRRQRQWDLFASSSFSRSSG